MLHFSHLGRFGVFPVLETAKDGARAATALGTLPEWDLDDLYPGRDSEAVQSDLALMLESAEAFEEAHKGTLDDLVKGAGGERRDRA